MNSTAGEKLEDRRGLRSEQLEWRLISLSESDQFLRRWHDACSLKYRGKFDHANGQE